MYNAYDPTPEDYRHALAVAFEGSERLLDHDEGSALMETSGTADRVRLVSHDEYMAYLAALEALKPH